ncbi:MAG: TRAP transporter large permease subunit [Desulfobacteraceae bacterium]|nr:MAG: TRAP transporter large permease subunit [Desulfobacteraceae bacterium]
MDVGFLTALLFLSLVLLLVIGMPLAFCLGLVGLSFTYWLWGTPAILQIASAAFGPSLNIILIAVPLFIFMANVLQFSGMADGLYDVFHRWSGGIKGGLAMGTVAVCAIFAAMSGISGAATVAMGVIAIPSMIKRNYDRFLATGCVAAGGALGILIPPSVVMIIYASFSGVSVGKLFMAGVLPGFFLAGLFLIYIAVRCLINHELGPALPLHERATWAEKFYSLKGIIFPLLLVLAVIGSIFFGFATPTEAAAIGAIGSLVCAAINRKLSWSSFKDACHGTMRLSTMIIWIVIGASCFSNVYTAIGAPDFLNSLIVEAGLGKWTVLLIMQVTYFILGMLMDPTGIVMITTPIYVPIITSLGFDPIWFGILFILNMEMGYLTPPFGYNLFYIRSIISPDIMSMKDIYISVFPFIFIQGFCLITIILFPGIALYLPNLMK